LSKLFLLFNMKLNSLYIDDYKLLRKFNINFKKDVSILIGINGSGKSNILETIAQIFSDAFLKEKSKFGFKIEYELRLEVQMLEKIFFIKCIQEMTLLKRWMKLKNALTALKEYYRATL